MSETTRQKALEKLDEIILLMCYPDEWTDFSELALPSATGGSLLEDAAAIRTFNAANHAALLETGADRTYWYNDVYSAHVVNAWYDPSLNTVTIPLGILGGGFYGPDRSYEQNLGGIGAVMGHEITHGFDDMGSRYDGQGNLSDWWTAADRAAFDEKCQLVADRFDSIEALDGIYCLGEPMIGEAVADLGSISIILEIAADRNGFDYRELFEQFAHMWQKLGRYNYIANLIEIDVHPLSYLRVNVTLSQYQVFLDTYGVERGDGMYVAPEDRIAVW